MTVKTDPSFIFPRRYKHLLQEVTFQKGEAICLQGQAITALTYVLSGKLKISRTLFNGKEHVLEMPALPTLIGDIELMTNQVAGSSVIALEDVQALQLPLSNKEALLQDPDFLYKIGQKLALTLHKQAIISSTNASYSVKERLATYILAVEEEGSFQLSPSSLAENLGTSYRHVQRVIRQLLDQDVIVKTAFKHYQITDRKTLERLTIID